MYGQREGERRTKLTDDEIVMDGYWRQEGCGERRREGDDRIGRTGGVPFQIKLVRPSSHS